jgi:hypothetical protein
VPLRVEPADDVPVGEGVGVCDGDVVTRGVDTAEKVAIENVGVGDGVAPSDSDAVGVDAGEGVVVPVGVTEGDGRVRVR